MTPSARTVAQGPISMWTPCDGRKVAVPVLEREAAVGAREQLGVDLDGTGIEAAEPPIMSRMRSPGARRPQGLDRARDR